MSEEYCRMETRKRTSIGREQRWDVREFNRQESWVKEIQKVSIIMLSTILSTHGKKGLI